MREEDVEIAVGVVVEKRSTGPRHLHEVELAGHAVVIGEIEAGSGGRLEEKLADAGGLERSRGQRHHQEPAEASKH